MWALISIFKPVPQYLKFTEKNEFLIIDTSGNAKGAVLCDSEGSSSYNYPAI